MRLFNSLQVVAMYAGGPWVIGWLFNDPFIYSNVAAWLSTILYAIFSVLMVGAVYVASERWDR